MNKLVEICSAHHHFSFSDDILRLDVLKKPHDVSTDRLAYTCENRFANHYTPPESMPDQWDLYDPLKADSWCAGVLLYKMVTGLYPYRDEDPDILSMKICQQRLAVPINLSESLKSLLHMLLNKKWEDRVAIENALLHPWIRRATKPKKEETIHTLFT